MQQPRHERKCVLPVMAAPGGTVKNLSPTLGRIWNTPTAPGTLGFVMPSNAKTTGSSAVLVAPATGTVTRTVCPVKLSVAPASKFVVAARAPTCSKTDEQQPEVEPRLNAEPQGAKLAICVPFRR